VVEGQGSMIHPGYSGVSLAIMHGCCPDLMILCHDPARAEIEGYGMKIPPLSQLVRLYEEASAPVLRSRVVAVALNTYRLSEEEARRHREEAQQETGLPVGDVVRWGCEDIYRSLGRLV
jgi:uncharacterized NAD-dependent epimerase/dehydratase family protein